MSNLYDHPLYSNPRRDELRAAELDAANAYRARRFIDADLEPDDLEDGDDD